MDTVSLLGGLTITYFKFIISLLISYIKNKSVQRTTVVKPIKNTLFTGRHWVFPQDPQPAHKTKTTQS